MARCLCTSQSDPKIERMIAEVNGILAKHPVACFSTYLGINYSVFGVAFIGLKMVGFNFPELAAAAVVSRVLRRSSCNP